MAQELLIFSEAMQHCPTLHVSINDNHSADKALVGGMPTSCITNPDDSPSADESLDADVSTTPG